MVEIPVRLSSPLDSAHHRHTTQSLDITFLRLFLTPSARSRIIAVQRVARMLCFICRARCNGRLALCNSVRTSMTSMR